MNFDIKFKTILLVLAGSHAYGIATPESDIDCRGIAIAPLNIRLSNYNRFEQYEGSWPFDSDLNSKKLRELSDGNFPSDIVIYDIAKAIKLMGDCNPNMLEIIFTDSEDILICDEFGKRLRACRNDFVSLKCKFTYSGYGKSQLYRIKRHRGYLLGDIPKKPNRKDYNLPEHGSFLNETESNLINEEIKSRLDSWGIDDFEMKPAERDVLKQRMREFWSYSLNCNEEDLDGRIEDSAALSLGLTEEVRDALNRERKYRAALKNYNSYQTWKSERNPKRQKLEEKFGYDTKHASHLIRILRQGNEILSTGNVIVKRPDAEELIGIRNGIKTFEEIVNEADFLENKMNELYKQNPCNLPKTPDLKRLDALLQEIILMELRQLTRS